MDLSGRVERTAARIEDVRMPANQLGRDRLQGIGDGELPGVSADLREKHTLEDEIADLAPRRVRVASIDRVEHFVRLFEDERAQRFERLLAIPWTALRSAQAHHDVDERLES